MGLSRFSAKILDAFDAGWQVVTPNNRLARQLARAYEMRQRTQSQKIWAAPTVLPWSAFIDVLWQRLSDRAALPLRIRQQAALLLWTRMTAEDQGPVSLLAPERAARLAQDAWRLLHEWRHADEKTPWRRWVGHETYDVHCFCRWAEKYWQLLQEKNLVDDALVPEFLETHASLLVDENTPPLLLAGFIELAPDVLRVTAALRAAGLCIHTGDTLDAPVSEKISRFAARERRDEWRQALSWAWQRCEQGQTAIIIPDLAHCIDDVRRCVEEIIPQKSYCNISLGETLDRRALVRSALDLLRLYHGTLSVGKVSSLLQSPYLPGDIRLRAARAGLARKWLKEGRRELSFTDVVTSLREADGALHQSWREVERKARRKEMLPEKASADMWPRYLYEFWQALGWPGARSLDSAAHQLFQEWRQCVESLIFLDPLASGLRGEFKRGEIMDVLTRQAETEVFQPHDPGASIHIMGVLEASGLPFDALWISGLDAQSWPSAIVPHPLLPLSWQRKQGMRRADLELNRRFCETMQEQWRHAAPQVVMSYAQQQEGELSLPAALMRDLPAHEPDYPLLETRAARTTFKTTEKIADDQAPPIDWGNHIAAEHISHGSTVIGYQSDCPFKAFSCARLRINEWPQADDGLSAAEHGILVHATLQHLWAALKTQKQLLSLSSDELNAVIEQAYREACSALDAQRWAQLPKPIADVARMRVMALIQEWCALEKARTPFVVRQFEERVQLALSGLTFDLKIDRVDQLVGDDQSVNVAIIDYKTGKAGATQKWFDERPTNIQIGLYALALQQEEPSLSIAALAYAQVRSGEMQWVGAQEHDDIPGLANIDSFNMGSLRQAQERWQMIFTSLTEAFVRGDARVAPREKKVCQYCHVQPFCRIKTVRDFDGEENDEA